MAKPWSRYQVGFIDHPKFQHLPANAICLWIEGKNYADEHLTDGYLPMAAIRKFRFYTKRNMALLMASVGPKNVAGSHYEPLWESHALGVKMHDYLDHNECADTVRARMAQADAERDANRLRQQRFREKQQSQTGAKTPDVTPSVTPDVTPLRERDANASVTPYTETEEEILPPTPLAGGVVARAKAELQRAELVLASDDVAQKAVAFMELYPALYAKCRSGAVYRVREARDFDTFCELVTQWPDLNHLSDMLRLFLLRKEFAPKNEPGSPRQFAWMAPQCDAMLREAKRRAS